MEEKRGENLRWWWWGAAADGTLFSGTQLSHKRLRKRQTVGQKSVCLTANLTSMHIEGMVNDGWWKGLGKECF